MALDGGHGSRDGRPPMRGITAGRRAADLLLRPLADDLHLDPPRLPAPPPARPRRSRPDPGDLRLAVRGRDDRHARLRPVRRGRVLGPDQPAGLARLRAPAAGHAPRAPGSPDATRTRRRRSTPSTGWSPTATPATRSPRRAPSASATTSRRRRRQTGRPTRTARRARMSGPRAAPRPARGADARAQAGGASSSATMLRDSPRNAPRRHATRIARAVPATMIVEIALISGVIPNLILP